MFSANVTCATTDYQRLRTILATRWCWFLPAPRLSHKVCRLWSSPAGSRDLSTAIATAGREEFRPVLGIAYPALLPPLGVTRTEYCVLTDYEPLITDYFVLHGFPNFGIGRRMSFVQPTSQRALLRQLWVNSWGRNMFGVRGNAHSWRQVLPSLRHSSRNEPYPNA